MKTFILLAAMLIVSHQNVRSQVNVGDPAPDFTLGRLDIDDTITLSDLKDKVIYIFFYGAGCPHCRQNGPVTERDIHQKYMDNPAFVALGLDTWNDPISNNNAFRAVTGITYPLLLQARQTLVAYYGNTSSYDRSVVIGADGILRYKGTGWVNSDVRDVQQVIENELEAVSTSLEPEETPGAFVLEQNYPNPFNPATVIRYQIPVGADGGSSANVRLEVYDSLGRRVAVLVNERQGSGSYSVRFDGAKLASGMYIYRLIAGDVNLSRRMMLIK